MADEVKDEGGSGMTLEAAIEAIKQVLLRSDDPREHEPGADTELLPVDGAGLELAVDPAAVAVVAADADMSKKDDEKKRHRERRQEGREVAAMDQSITSKSLSARSSAATPSAGQLAKHVGTFDHSEMTEAEVASYGVKKLRPQGADRPRGGRAVGLHARQGRSGQGHRRRQRHGRAQRRELRHPSPLERGVRNGLPIHCQLDASFGVVGEPIFDGPLRR